MIGRSRHFLLVAFFTFGSLYRIGCDLQPLLQHIKPVVSYLAHFYIILNFRLILDNDTRHLLYAKIYIDIEICLFEMVSSETGW